MIDLPCKFLKLPTKVLLIVLLVLNNGLLLGQYADFAPQDFTLRGDAIDTDNDCFQLTADNYWQGGGVWYKNMVNLDEVFEIEMKVFFGCNFDGADGIVFILHPRLGNGFQGEGMGFGGLIPSFGVEMDTYFNPHLRDPLYDHVAFMQNGVTNHRLGISRPLPLSKSKKNVKDCKTHLVKMTWDPTEKQFSFYFDGTLRMRKKVDLVGDIFKGESMLNWGFTAATGGQKNQHMICLDKITMTETSALPVMIKKLLHSGEGYNIPGLDFSSGSAKIPEIGKKSLDQIVLFLKKHPNQAIILKGYTDNTGSKRGNQKISENRAKAVADHLKAKGINGNRIYFYGLGEKDPIATNDTEEGREKNRRVELTFRIIRV